MSSGLLAPSLGIGSYLAGRAGASVDFSRPAGDRTGMPPSENVCGIHIFVEARLVLLDDLIVATARLYRSPAMRRALIHDVPGLTSIAHLRVLRAVERRSRRGESPTIRDVASDLDIEQSTASREVGAVVEQGLLLKTVCPTDLRKTRLALKEEGRRMLSLATEARLRWLGDATRDWSAGDIAQLTELLDRLLRDYGPLDEETSG